MGHQGGGLRQGLVKASRAAVGFLIGAAALAWIVKQTPLWDPAASAVYSAALRSGLVLPQRANGPLAVPSPPGAPAKGAGPAGARAGRPIEQDRLMVTHAEMDLAAREGTSARIDAGGVAKEERSSSGRPGRKPFKTPRLKPNTSFSSNVIRYGVSSRSDLMGRGAGPVYNFKSNSGAAASRQLPGSVGAGSQGADELPESVKSGLRDASDRIEKTRKTVDTVPQLTPEGRATINGGLDDAQKDLNRLAAP